MRKRFHGGITERGSIGELLRGFLGITKRERERERYELINGKSH